MFTKLINRWKTGKRKKALREFGEQLNYILHVNDDLLGDSTKEKVRGIICEAEAVRSENGEESRKFLERAPLRVAKILPRKRWPTLREYADFFAVAFTVIFGARVLFLQLFNIPTSSMQPTLFGCHYIADKKTLPHLPGFIHWLVFSTQRAELRVKKSGCLDPESIVTYKRFIFFPRSRFSIAGIVYDLPGEYDAQSVGDTVQKYCLKNRTEFGEGEVLCNGWLSLGDHLFVDRTIYHLREPRRGDIVVFNTEKLPCMASGFFYIKRLIGMPGDTLKIRDGKVFVKEKGKSDFVPITDFKIKGIEKIYSMRGGYHGHLPLGSLSEIKVGDKPVENEVMVPENCYFMMGDNSAHSSDSRMWGFVPRRNIVGRAFFVFWPFTRRWGSVDHEEPLPFDTGKNPLEIMKLQ